MIEIKLHRLPHGVPVAHRVDPVAGAQRLGRHGEHRGAHRGADVEAVGDAPGDGGGRVKANREYELIVRRDSAFHLTAVVSAALCFLGGAVNAVGIRNEELHAAKPDDLVPDEATG